MIIKALQKSFKFISPISSTTYPRYFFSSTKNKIKAVQQQISAFQNNFRQVIPKIPLNSRSNEITQIISKIQQYKNNALTMNKYNIKVFKKHVVLNDGNDEEIDKELKEMQNGIKEVNLLYEELLVKLHQKMRESGEGVKENTDFNQLKEKIIEFKDKIIGSLRERYANGKMSLTSFIKRYYFALLGLVLLGYLYYSYLPQQISIQKFTEMKVNSNINEVDIVTLEGKKSSRIIEFTVDGKSYYIEVDSQQALNQFLEKNPNVKCQYKRKMKFMGYFEKYSEFISISSLFLIILMNAIIFMYFAKNKGANMESIMTQGDKKSFDMIKQTGVRFSNVIGLGESKHEISQFVDFLKNSEKYKKLGAKIPRGVLLTGPPGTGKTLLAKACAGEAGVPFFYCSGSDFVQVFVGVGASRVRDLFSAAQAASPAIVFIDEIDGVGKKRSKTGRNDERDGTLNQLLVEMDGFSTNHNVVVMGATNRKELLDEALIRPGRFDRIVDINLPDLQGRFDMFSMYLKNKPLEGDLIEIAKRMGTLTPGMSGADIANLCNEAAILAARASKQKIDENDLEKATERVIGGLERKNLMDEKDKKVVAVHESGHAVVAWFLEGAYPLLKVTIIPRSKGALGYAQYLPKESNLDSKEQLLDRISYILAGRCAEEYFFNSITTGASDDLQKAYKIAYSIVTRFGMSDELGLVGYDNQRFVKQYSKSKAKVIDREIKKIIDRCIVVTKNLIKEHEDKIKRMSDKLFEKQTLNANDIVDLLGPRPFKPHSTYQKYLELFQKKQEQKNKLTEKLPEQKENTTELEGNKQK